MALYVLATGLIAQKYPYTYGDLRRDNPDTCFPDVPTANFLRDLGVHVVQRVDPPEHDPEIQRPQEQMPVHIDGVWYQVWTLRPATGEEAAYAVREKKAAALRRELETTRPQQSVPALVERIEKLEQFLGLKAIP